MFLVRKNGLTGGLNSPYQRCPGVMQRFLKLDMVLLPHVLMAVMNRPINIEMFVELERKFTATNFDSSVACTALVEKRHLTFITLFAGNIQSKASKIYRHYLCIKYYPKALVGMRSQRFKRWSLASSITSHALTKYRCRKSELEAPDHQQNLAQQL